LEGDLEGGFGDRAGFTLEASSGAFFIRGDVFLETEGCREALLANFFVADEEDSLTESGDQNISLSACLISANSAAILRRSALYPVPGATLSTRAPSSSLRLAKLESPPSAR